MPNPKPRVPLFFILLLLLVLITAGCSSSSSETTATLPPSTDAPVSPTTTSPPATATFTATLTSTETLIPTSTLSPTITSTPVPPVLTVTTNTVCLTGPGFNYVVVAYVGVGESLPIDGRDEAGEFWWVKPWYKDAHCWVADQFVTVEGDTAHLEIIEAPVTPTPIPSDLFIFNFFINPNTGGNIACGDSIVPLAIGHLKSGDTADDVLTALRALFATGVKNHAGFYNALYRSGIRVKSASFNTVTGKIQVDMEGTVVHGNDDCEKMRIEAQVLYTLWQFTEIKSRLLLLNGVPFEDFTYVP